MERGIKKGATVFSNLLRLVLDFFDYSYMQITASNVCSLDEIKNWCNDGEPRKIEKLKNFLDRFASKIRTRLKTEDFRLEVFKKHINELEKTNPDFANFDDESDLVVYIQKTLTFFYHQAKDSKNRLVPSNKKKAVPVKYTGVVAFDLDGTLIRGIRHSWPYLWEIIGLDPVRDGLKHKKPFVEKRIYYDTWLQHDLDDLQKGGITEQRIKDFFKNNAAITVTKKLEEAIEYLKKCNYATAIISGGIDSVLYHFIPDADVLFDRIYINRFIWAQNGQLQKIVPTKYDWDSGKKGVEGKAAGLKQLCEEFHVSLENSVFVGDDENDAEAMRVAGNRVFYCSTSPGRPVLDVNKMKIITDDNLMLVANYIVHDTDEHDIY